MRTRLITLIAAWALLLAGCLGSTVEDPGAEPEPEPESATGARRIVSLAPSMTEMLFAIGAQDRIVGVTSFCDYPPEVEDYPRIGSFMRPSLELIVAAKPDLIIAAGFETHPLKPKFEQAGLNLVVITPRTPDEILELILELGRLTDRERAAAELAAELGARLERVRRAVDAVPRSERPRVFIEVGYPPLIAAGPGSFVSSIVEAAGGVNALEGQTELEWPQVSSEKVFALDPDMILLGYMAGAGPDLARRTGWERIPAVIRDRVVHDIDIDLYLRPGPRFILGVEAIHERLRELPGE